MMFKNNLKKSFLKKKEETSGAFNAPEEKEKDGRKLEYEKAKMEYINNITNQAKALNSWKLAFFFTFLLAIISVSYSFYLAQRSTLIPYVIEVDETGNAKGINPVYQVAYNPEEMSKEYFIRELIYKSRTITLDNVLNGVFYKNNMYFLNPVAREKYHVFLKQDNLTEKIKEGITRQVTINSLNKIAGTNNSYQARWTEETFENTGASLGNQKMLGTFILKINQPTSLEKAHFNPLGIMIEDYTITKEN